MTGQRTVHTVQRLDLLLLREAPQVLHLGTAQLAGGLVGQHPAGRPLAVPVVQRQAPVGVQRPQRLQARAVELGASDALWPAHQEHRRAVSGVYSKGEGEERP